jgi:DNA-binding response OmpR family regulator
MGYFHHYKEGIVMKILVVEDEIALAEALSEILKRNKYNVDAVYDGDDGLSYAMTGIYDCIILDIMLPKMNGIDVLRILRRKHISTPVLLLTAKSEVEDKINGLDSGADDFLTKPFITGELLARVRALTRRKGEVITDQFTFGDIALNKTTFSLSREGQFVKLSLKEFQIMEMLIANPRQLIPKERFIEKIWGYESDIEYNNVEVYISFLRKKLSAIESTVTIRTARGVGYFLEGGD